MDDLLGFRIDNIVLLVDVESGCDHRYRNGLAQVLVFPDPHDDIRAVAGLGLDMVVDLTYLVDCDLLGARYDQQQYVLGPGNLVVVQQGGIQCLHDRLLGTGRTGCRCRTHDGRPAVG